MKDFKLLALFGLQCAQEAIAEQIRLVEEAIALDHGRPRRGRPPGVANAPLLTAPAQDRKRRPVSIDGREAIVKGQREGKIRYWVNKIQAEGGDPEEMLKHSKVRLAVLKRLRDGGSGSSKSKAATEARRANIAKGRAVQAQKRLERQQSLEPKKGKSRYLPKNREKWLANVRKAARARRDREALAKAATASATGESQE